MIRSGLLLTLAMVSLLASVAAGDAFPTAGELTDRLEEMGFQALPERDSFAFEGGIAAVLPGEVEAGDTKPYVLVIAGPPAPRDVLWVLAANGTAGFSWEGRKVPALFASLGRHVIVVYLDDPTAVTRAGLPLDEIAAVIDLSEADALRANCLLIRATGSSSTWRRLIEQTNIPLGVCLQLEEAPMLGSPIADTMFSQQIPGLQLETPEMESGPVDGGFIGRIPSTFGAFLAAKVSRLDEPPVFQRIERSDDVPKAGKRPHTGTIPSYTADVEGLLLEGVLEGGPAEAAGLMAGDVIVELAGKAITDVHTYAAALDSLEIDVPISVVFLRNGERTQTTLTPQGR